MLLLLACGVPGEAELFASALEAPDVATALGLCARIEDPFVAGECSTASMALHAPDLEACKALEVVLWRDECVFSAAEAMAAEDLRAAVDACHDSRFARECSFHLIRDRARTVATVDAATASSLAATLGDIRRAPDALFLFWQEWFVAGRQAGLAANPARCEGASDPLDCIEGLRRLAHQTARSLGPEVFCRRLAEGDLAADLDPGPQIRAELMDLCEPRD